MGADPEAILFYGIPLPEVNVSYHDLNELWEKAYRPAEPENQPDYRAPEWDEWRTRLAEWKTTAENVRIDWSGGEDCEHYYVHCDNLKVSVEWDEMIPIGPDALAEVDSAAAKEMLYRFCDQFNLPKGEPGWHLAARYF